MVRVALEMVPASIDMLGRDIQQGIARHTRDGVPECYVVCRAMPRRRKRVRAN